MGVDTGDGVNYYELCISRSNALLDLEQVRQSCDSEAGVLAFRVDSVNPDQGMALSIRVRICKICGKRAYA